MKAQALAKLQGEMEFCNSCPLFADKIASCVFDNGNPDADLVIVAEAAGADEQKIGLPLVGRCGKLIEEMLNHIGMSRKDTWRMNCIACRPPNNRDPKAEEIEACSYFFNKQLSIIQPKVIVTLGKYSTQLLLGSEEPIGKLVNKWYENEQGTVDLFAMYHPSYILRNGDNMLDGYKWSWEQVKDKLNAVS